MRSFNHAGSIFLRSILKRMKSLGLNQSALARRMNVSRAYISKALAGDVNFSFSTACRFARALEMDFLPGLAPRRSRSKVEVDSGRVLVAFVFACLATLTCRAAMVPSWLPEDQRFEVVGTSNEIAQVDHTLALMRDSLHPKLRELMKEGDLGPTIQWIVHMSQPNVTNEEAYINSYQTPLLFSAFDCAMLTNRASKLSSVPSMVRLSLVFADDGRPDSIARAIPGVDYPGVSYEDEGSTNDIIRLTLCAPKSFRRFKVHAEGSAVGGRDCEFLWKVPVPRGISWQPVLSNRATACSDWRIIGVDSRLFSQTCRKEVLVFVRQKGGLWGPPGRITISLSNFGTRSYDSTGLLESIDYNGFRDVYRYGEKDCMLGFTRYLPGMIRWGEYSNMGEKIVDSYSDDCPKVTRKSIYSVVDGAIKFVDGDADVHHKRNEPIVDRSAKW